MTLPTACLLILGLILAGSRPAFATNFEQIQEVRENLVVTSLLQADIGRQLKDPQIVALGESAADLWSMAPEEAFEMIFPEKPGEAPRIRKLRWQTDRLLLVHEHLKQRKIAMVSPAADDWPQSDCPIDGADGVSWQAYMDTIYATDAAAVIFQAASIACEKIIIEPIAIEQGFTIESPETCGGALEGTPIPEPICFMEVFGAPFGEGVIVAGGGLMENPSEGACDAAAKALMAAQKTQETFEAFLDCDGSATAEANYRRLDFIQAEVKAMQDFVASMRRMLFEHALAIRGGSRMATAYLDSAQDGLISETAETVKTALEKTRSAGYRMAPRIDAIIADAEEERSQGNFKRAYDDYREAYKLTTRKSLELETTTGGTP